MNVPKRRRMWERRVIGARETVWRGAGEGRIFCRTAGTLMRMGRRARISIKAEAYTKVYMRTLVSSVFHVMFTPNY